MIIIEMWIKCNFYVDIPKQKVYFVCGFNPHINI